MRKSKRILTSFLAIALVLSNLSLSTLTVNATEATDAPIVGEQNETGSVSQNEPGSENETGSVSENEPGDESVSGNTPGTTPPSEGSGEGGGTAPDQGEGGGSANEVILNFNQLGTPLAMVMVNLKWMKLQEPQHLYLTMAEVHMEK